jgi:hypothetical protein
MKPAVIFICAALCAAACSSGSAPAPAAPLKVLSFNLLRFDNAKAADPKTAAFMASLLRDADVAALQEGLQVSAEAVRAFAEMAGPNRGFLLGPPQGRNGFYRENFVFIYNTDRVTLAASALYPDADKIFERPPMAAHFKTASSGFIVLNCHIKPDETGGQTAREIAALPKPPAASPRSGGKTTCWSPAT